MYEHPDFRGDSVTFRNEIPDLREHGLNDRITSLEVDGNQAWEVCRDVNFGGGCRTFTGTIDDLREAGWNDRISSLRAVGYGRATTRRRGGTIRAIGQLAQQPRVAAGALLSAELSRRSRDVKSSAISARSAIAHAASRSTAARGSCVKTLP